MFLIEKTISSASKSFVCVLCVRERKREGGEREGEGEREREREREMLLGLRKNFFSDKKKIFSLLFELSFE
jgi:hypothetical protein